MDERDREGHESRRGKGIGAMELRRRGVRREVRRRKKPVTKLERGGKTRLGKGQRIKGDRLGKHGDDGDDGDDGDVGDEVGVKWKADGGPPQTHRTGQKREARYPPLPG